MTRTTLLAVALAIILVAPCNAGADAKVLCEKVSRYNTILVTEDEQGLRTLWFDLRAVRRALSPKGIAVANVFGPKWNRLYDSIVRTYQDVFDELYILDAPGTNNQILIAQPYKGRFRRLDLARQARKVSQEGHFRFDLADFVLHGFQHVGKQTSRGRVLTDDNEPDRPAKDGGEPRR